MVSIKYKGRLFVLKTFCILLIYIAKWGAYAHGRPVESPPAQIIQPTACVQGQNISKGSPQLSNLGILTDSQLHHISAESVSSFHQKFAILEF